MDVPRLRTAARSGKRRILRALLAGRALRAVRLALHVGRSRTQRGLYRLHKRNLILRRVTADQPLSSGEQQARKQHKARRKQHAPHLRCHRASPFLRAHKYPDSCISSIICIKPPSVKIPSPESRGRCKKSPRCVHSRGHSFTFSAQAPCQGCSRRPHPWSSAAGNRRPHG